MSIIHNQPCSFTSNSSVVLVMKMVSSNFDDHWNSPVHVYSRFSSFISDVDIAMAVTRLGGIIQLCLQAAVSRLFIFRKIKNKRVLIQLMDIRKLKLIELVEGMYFWTEILKVKSWLY